MKYAFIFSILGILAGVGLLSLDHFIWFYIILYSTLIFNICWLLFGLATRTGKETRWGWWIFLSIGTIILLFYGNHTENKYEIIKPYQLTRITLIPANEPTPSLPVGCSTLKTPVASSSLLLFMGNSLYISTKNTQDVSTYHDNSLLNVSHNSQGQISINADVWNIDGTLVGQIMNDSFLPATSTKLSISNPDKSTTIIYDQSGNELLYFHFINSLTMSLRGIFSDEVGSKFQIQQNKQIIGPLTFSEDCLRNSTIHMGNN